MRVVAQRGRRIPVPKALLGPEQLASSDEERRHTVAQAVQRRLGDFGPPGKLRKSVAEGARGQSDVVICPRGEQPRAEGGAVG